MLRRTSSALTAAGAVTGLFVLPLAAAGPAVARLAVVDHFEEVSNELLEDFCGDLDVAFESRAEGVLHVSRHGDGQFYFLENLRFTNSYTNLDNSLTATHTGVLHNKEVTIVDHGDGTLTLNAHGTGVLKLHAPDGSIFVLNAAAIFYRIDVSDAGTPDDPFDDFEIGAEVITKKVGRDDSEGRDFCTDLHELIG